MRFWIGLSLALGVVAGCESPPPVPVPTAPPTTAKPAPLRNLILVSIDTQRADRLALYGGDVATPNLARTAARGALFERAYSHAPITAPSHSSLFTSTLPSEHGVHNNGQALTSELPTLAGLLRGHGRATGAFVSLAALSGKFGYGAGFDTYADARTRKYWWTSAEEVNAEALPWIEAHHRRPFFAFVHYSDPHEPYLSPRSRQRIEVRCDGAPLDDLVVDGRRLYVRTPLPPGTTRLTLTARGAYPVRTENWKWTEGLRVEPGDGFAPRPDGRRHPYLNYATLTPGVPATVIVHDERPRQAGAGAPAAQGISIRFDGVPRQEPEDRRREYDLESAYVDRALGPLLSLLDREDLWRSTAVVVTADHGEELGEHGGRFGHVHFLRESLIHVPLIVVAPGFFAPRSRVAAVVRQIDLLPTLAQVLDFAAPAGARGRTLWPAASIEARIAVAQTYRPQAVADRTAAVELHHKLVRAGQGRATVFHDLRTDPDERHPLRSEPGPDSEAGRAWRRLQSAIDRAGEGTARTVPEVALDDADVEALRALGYVE